jgi:Fe-S-cluster-containing hydrogenase component 2
VARPLSKDTDFQVASENCVGCYYCQMACSFVKFRLYDRANAYISVERDHNAGKTEQYKVRFLDLCDSCAFCLEYCYFDALRNLKKPKEIKPLVEPGVSKTYLEA